MPFSIFLFLLLLLNPSGAAALTPITIDRADHSYGSDQNHIPSDPGDVATTRIDKTINISESFDCIEVGSTGVGGSQTSVECAHQKIDDIQQKVNSREINNNAYIHQEQYRANVYADPLADKPVLKKAFLTLDVNKNTSNSTRRSLTAQGQRCQLAQQIKQIVTFINGGNSVCVDREINTSKGKVKVSEIFAALIPQVNGGVDLAVIKKRTGQTKLFYADPNCPKEALPSDFPSDIVSTLKGMYSSFRFSTDEYLTMYLQGVEPVCVNSLAHQAIQCDLNDKGEEVNCKDPVKRSEARASGYAQTFTAKTILKRGTKPVDKDYAEDKKVDAAVDKPNPIGWLAQFFKAFWDAILPDQKTFSGPTVVHYDFDNRMLEGLKYDETSMIHLFPAKDIKEKSLRNQTATGTNNVTIDPGLSNDTILSGNLSKTLQPASWHP